ncbi:hypothetical protein CUJ88_47000 (plasmid) [Paraburkholderia hospita]|nr:hypothetical protein CUJ88_47000 [Paraburkholderia hospita]
MLARHLAIGFHEGQFSFWFCDAIVNAVVGFVYDDCLADGDDLPALFSAVYLAFDAGKVDCHGIELIEAFTRPMIAEIAEDLRSDARKARF